VVFFDDVGFERGADGVWEANLIAEGRLGDALSLRAIATMHCAIFPMTTINTEAPDPSLHCLPARTKECPHIEVAVQADAIEP